MEKYNEEFREKYNKETGNECFYHGETKEPTWDYVFWLEGELNEALTVDIEEETETFPFFQCPYDPACKCTMVDPCKGCETWAKYLREKGEIDEG